jgi:hypothetical protein
VYEPEPTKLWEIGELLVSIICVSPKYNLYLFVPTGFVALMEKVMFAGVTVSFPDTTVSSSQVVGREEMVGVGVLVGD